ncbi:MAG: glycosyltransferase family 2 protein [Methanobacteriota archaeon]|nr:MAG: glycosyltransferase family 2 protein [Euryarchaeota archaeon]
MGVSAILPIHDEATVLGRVLDAIDRQSWRPDELVCVLDDCRDESEAIVRTRPAKVVRVKVRNTAAALAAGISETSHEILLLFDGNTLVPIDYAARLLEAFETTGADLVEWHGGMMLLPRSTLDRYGPFSRMHLWTLEYFLRVESRGGQVVRLNGPHKRLKRSPLGRNIRYGLDYSALVERYGIAPFFRIGTKSGWIPDLFAAIGTIVGHVKNRRLWRALQALPGAIRDR